MLHDRTFFLILNLGQAQYIRVPYADFNALVLPPGQEHEADFILLAGTLNWHSVLLSRILTGHNRYFPNRCDCSRSPRAIFILYSFCL